MITRRTALTLIAAASYAPWLRGTERGRTPPLAPGAPASPERQALIDDFKKRSEGLEKKFEARIHKSDWTMPYRLFRPEAAAKLPLVIYLHGSGALGTDNEKQLGLGNSFGTRVWLLPENQKNFPCFVLAPQTDRGWSRYGTAEGERVPPSIAGFGDGNRLVAEIVDELRRELRIDERRIYVTGQSMGGAGVWNMVAYRPGLFAAAVPLCGSKTVDDGSASPSIPVWNFHGTADPTVPVTVSRERIAARRKAGGHPIHTEYEGVEHNVWQWAYTEPELPKWLFAQRR